MGLFSAVAPYLQNLVTGHGVDLDNRCVWVTVFF